MYELAECSPHTLRERNTAERTYGVRTSRACCERRLMREQQNDETGYSVAARIA